MGGLTLSGSLLNFSRIATDITLGVMLAFTLQYLTGGSWWKRPIGWSIVTERVSYVLLLALLVAQAYWPFSIAASNDFLEAEGLLLLAASVGVGMGTVVMWRVQRRPVPQRVSRAEILSQIMALPLEDRVKLRASLDALA